MSTIRYPSEQFPAPPALSLDLPEKWSALDTAGVALAATRQVEPGEFRPNVVVMVSRVGAQYPLESAIADVIAKLEGAAGYQELGREQCLVGGHPGFRIEGAFSDDQVGSLMQGVRLARVDRGPVIDIVQVTVSAAGAQAQELWGELRGIQDSLQIDA